MRAIWLEKRSLYLRDVPVPTPQAGEALVRVRLAGICATDLELVRGYYPFTGIPGHEFVGEVVDAPGGREWLGQRIVGEINAVCGLCETCLRGDSTHCERRTVLGIAGRYGAFAEFLCLPFENLHVVPAQIPDEAAVFTEPLAAALEILTQIDVSKKDRVLLVGAGRLGQLIAGVLAQTGCDLTVSARHPAQKKLLRDAGIRTAPADDIQPRSMDIVVEATGSPGGFADARRAVRPRGAIILKSTYAGSIQADFSAVVVDEITLIGSRCGPFDVALDWLAAGRIDPTPLIRHRYRLDDGLQAFEEAAKPGALKVLLEAGGASQNAQAGGR